MKTSTLVLLAFNLVLILFAGASYKIYTSFQDIEKQVQSAADTTARVIDLNFELSQTIKDIKFDVVQVQQWLTDISATRGFDGLNDGKDKATEFAKSFKQDTEKARELAQKLDLTEVVTAIDGIEQAFPPYYETGNKMADAYIAAGAEGGNKLMGDFDGVAQKISDAMDKLNLTVDAVTQESKNSVTTQLSDTEKEAQRTLGILIVVMSITFMMAALSSGFVFVLIKRRSKTMEVLADKFEESVHTLSQRLSGQATELLGQADIMRQSMGVLNQRTEATSMASTEASQNIQYVASATEELSSSVSEIRGQIAKSNDVIEESNTIMARAEKASDSLGNAVASISQVIDMIEGLAGQISMLALNATIESARAGEAGKGFAVVAGEVKNLAVATTQATGQITDKITEVKECSESVMDVLKALKHSMASVSEYAHSIGSAVNQQGSATEEIAHRMVSVSDHTKEIDENLQHVSNISDENHQSSLIVLSTADNLNKQSEELSVDVSNFLKDIRRMA